MYMAIIEEGLGWKERGGGMGFPLESATNLKNFLLSERLGLKDLTGNNS